MTNVERFGEDPEKHIQKYARWVSDTGRISRPEYEAMLREAFAEQEAMAEERGGTQYQKEDARVQQRLEELHRQWQEQAEKRQFMEELNREESQDQGMSQ